MLAWCKVCCQCDCMV